MSSIDKPNPYEILDLTPDADRAAITRAFALKNRGSGQERRQARKAYDALRKVENRLLVDSFLPLFHGKEQNLSKVLEDLLSEGEEIDWGRVVNLDINLHERLHELTKSIVQALFTELPQPDTTPQILSDYDDLEDFLNSWHR